MNSVTKKPFSLWRTINSIIPVWIVFDVFEHFVRHKPIFDIPFVWWQPIAYIAVVSFQALIFSVFFHYAFGYLFRLLKPSEEGSNSL